MSIIIQAGHKTSKSKEVMEKLYERGLNRPNDSYAHNMTPEQVSEMLYKVLGRKNMSSANEKMADNVMMDFLLANLDAENWGWESDKNLASLEYWQQIEPDVGFILVFDHPKNILKEFTNITLTADMIDQAMDEWVDYHQKILETLETYEDQAILIEGSCAADNISKLGTKIKSISSDLHLKKHWQVFKDAKDSTSDNDTDAVSQSSAAIDHVNNEILKKYPEVIKLFNTLLNKAAIKSSEPIYRTKQAELNSLIILFDSFNKLEKYQAEYQDIGLRNLLEEKLETMSKAKEEAERKVLESQNIVDKYKSKFNQINMLNNESYTSDDVIQLTQKNSLVEQIHFLQQKIDEYDVEIKRLKDRQKFVITTSPPKPVYYGAAKRVKGSLQYRLGSKMVNSKTPKAIAGLPFVLAKEYIDFQKKQNALKGLPELEDYQDIAEARRVEEHLSYKLGKVMTDSFVSPKNVVKLPISLSKELIEFKRK